MAVSKVVYSGQTLVDLTADTISASSLAAGVTAHGANGSRITGTYTPPVESVCGKTGAVTLTPADVGAAARRSFAATLVSSSWSASAPYTQTVAVSGLLATDGGVVDANVSGAATTDAGIAILEAWGCVSRVYASAANTLTAVCYEDKPEVNIPIRMEVMR